MIIRNLQLLAGVSLVKQFAVLVMIMLVVVFPRFDRADRFGLDQFTTLGKPATQHLGDAKHYINQVKYFRGEVGIEALKAPWVYRPIAALLATPLPFAPLTALNVVNLLALSVGLYALLLSMRQLGFSQASVFVGGLSYVVSFPVFFYAAIGYMDPLLVCWMSVGLYAIVHKKHILYFALLASAAFLKDPFIISLPAWLIYQLFVTKRYYFINIVVFVIAFAGFFTLLGVARYISGAETDFYWLPNQQMLDFNLYRVRSWLTWALTLGPIGVLASYYVIKQNLGLFKRAEDLMLTTGFAGAIAVMFYSMFTVYVDGRYFWIAYPFMIPLGCRVVDVWLDKRKA